MECYRNNYTNDFLGLPSKFNTMMGRETERVPFEARFENYDRHMLEMCPWYNRASAMERPMYPMSWDRFSPRTERFDRYWPMWNRFDNAERSWPMNSWNRSAEVPAFCAPKWTRFCDRSCSLNRLGECERHCGTMMPTERNWMDRWCNNTTLCNTSFRPCCDAEFYTLRNPVRSYDRNTRGLWLCFDLRGFRAEEVCCTFDRKERCITVEAAHETPKDVKEHAVIRKYTRKFVLPEYMKTCDLTKVELKCFIGRDGYFYIEGMLPTTCTFDNWPAPCQYPFYGCWSDERTGCWERRPTHDGRCHWNDDSIAIRNITCKYI